MMLLRLLCSGWVGGFVAVALAVSLFLMVDTPPPRQPWALLTNVFLVLALLWVVGAFALQRQEQRSKESK